MKVVQINSVCDSGSTGKICVAISKLLTENNIENYILYASGKSSYPLGIRYMSSIQVKIQALISKILGNYGFESRMATRRLIKMIDSIKPDIVQLHNLHGHNVNLEILFSHLKRKNIKIFWTFHDCFAFTAYCMYFDMTGCNKWMGGCEKCPQRKKYSWFFDRSKWLYEKKKKALSGLDLTIITPSQWLSNLTKKSFLKEYPVKVIYNGIDLSLFVPSKSDFRQKYSIPEYKAIILGVANKWEKRKGLDFFINLSYALDADNYQIVLVGTNDNVDKLLPENIISIHKTSNQKELAQIYSAADLFFNPTREDNFPTVNIEALSCGTPVLTFKTGGSPEVIDETCGLVLENDDIETIVGSIENVIENKLFSRENCLLRAKKFNSNDRFNEYINLYTD